MLPLPHLLSHGGFCPLLPALQISAGQGIQHPALSRFVPDTPRSGSSKEEIGAAGGSSWWQSVAPIPLLAEPWPRHLNPLCHGSQSCRRQGVLGPPPWRGTGRKGRTSPCLGLCRLERPQGADASLGACQASVRCWHGAGGRDGSGFSQSWVLLDQDVAVQIHGKGPPAGT